MRSHLILRSLLVSVTALSAIATAQPAAPPPAPAPDPAEVAYQEGRRLYDLREFTAAIAKFKEAYRLRNDAASLFNIAQSYRLLGDCPSAYDMYKTFQRNFPAERPDAVAKFIADLEPCKDPTPAQPPTPTPAPTPAPAPLAAPSAPARDEGVRPGGSLRIAGLTVGAVGVAALGTGVFFGLRARSRSADLDAAETWDPELESSAKRADRSAKILFGVGGAAVIGGAVLYYLGHRAAVHGGTVAVIPSPDGATVAWSLRLE